MTKREIRRQIQEDIEAEEGAIVECTEALDRIQDDVQEIKNEIKARKQTIRNLKARLRPD